MTTPAQKPHQRPPLTRLDPVREQRRIAADFAENVRLIEAAVAPSPDLVEQIAELRRLVRDQGAELLAQAARIAKLEAVPADDEDGLPLRGSGRWCRMKEAMRLTHYSRSGLLALCRRRRIRFDFEGAHRVIDVNSVPRKTSSAAAQSEHSE
jgi:hypothetical protein